MYLRQIIIRSLSGFLFLAPGMLLYFWVQGKQVENSPPCIRQAASCSDTI